MYSSVVLHQLETHEDRIMVNLLTPVNKTHHSLFMCVTTSAHGFNTIHQDTIANGTVEVRDEIQEVSGSDADWMLTSTVIIFTMQTGGV